MTKRAADTVGILIAKERRDGYFHVHGSPVIIGPTRQDRLDFDRYQSTLPGPKTIRNPRNDYGRLTNGLYLADLRVNSQGNDSDGYRKLYGFDVTYRDVFEVDYEKATRMAKTLTMIRKRLGALDDKFGRPTTYGQFMARVAAAITATKLVFRAEDGRRGWSYDDSNFKILDISDGVYQIDHMVTEWAAENKPTEETATA